MKEKKRILIVDDEPNIRRILQVAFEKEGYNNPAHNVSQMVGLIIYRFGSEELKRDVLTKILAGEAICSLGYSATAHGFRSAFRDWTADAGVARELAEISLQHAVGNATERAYWRSDLLEPRRALLDRWSAFCSGNS